MLGTVKVGATFNQHLVVFIDPRCCLPNSDIIASTGLYQCYSKSSSALVRSKRASPKPCCIHTITAPSSTLRKISYSDQNVQSPNPNPEIQYTVLPTRSEPQLVINKSYLRPSTVPKNSTRTQVPSSAHHSRMKPIPENAPGDVSLEKLSKMVLVGRLKVEKIMDWKPITNFMLCGGQIRIPYTVRHPTKPAVSVSHTHHTIPIEGTPYYTIPPAFQTLRHSTASKSLLAHLHSSIPSTYIHNQVTVDTNLWISATHITRPFLSWFLVLRV